MGWINSISLKQACVFYTFISGRIETVSSEISVDDLEKENNIDILLD